MSRAMIQAAVTMNQLQNKIDLIGNNLANSETTGYKNRQADFASLLFQQIDGLNNQAETGNRMTPNGVRVGSGAKLGSVNLDASLGSILETGRELDTALLQKNHLFQIQVENNDTTETQYTRDGAFYLNPINNNQSLLLTTKSGDPVLGRNGPIEIAPGFDSIEINENGQILVRREDQTDVAGTLTILEVFKPRLLEATGQNAFRLPDVDELGFSDEEIIQAVVPARGLLKNQALESSNVDIGKQMTDLIMAQRSYQFNARTISMGDQMVGLVNQLR